MSDQMPVEGNNIQLKCKVQGSPRPTITWYKDGQRFGPTREVSYKIKNHTTEKNHNIHCSLESLDFHFLI